MAAKRGRKARLNVGTRTAAAGISSMKRMSERIFARSAGSGGVKLCAGATSSRYSTMTEESMMIAPSWSSVGTTPLGLSLRYSGLSWSPASRSSFTSANGSCLALSTKRTRWLQVDGGALYRVKAMFFPDAIAAAVMPDGAQRRSGIQVPRHHRSILPVLQVRWSWIPALAALARDDNRGCGYGLVTGSTLQPGRYVLVLALELHAGGKRHGLGQGGKVLLQVFVRVLLQGGGAEVALDHLARGGGDRHDHVVLAPELQPKVEVLAQQLRCEGGGPVEIDQRRRLVRGEHRAHHAVVEEGQEGVARHAHLVGEQRDLDQVLDHHAEHDIVGDLADAGELAVADVGHAARREHLHHRLDRAERGLRAGCHRRQLAGIDDLGVAAHRAAHEARIALGQPRPD